MKTTLLLLAAVLATEQLPAQDFNDLYAPLMLYTNGDGRVLPFRDGQMLETGRRYSMIAIPSSGFAFSSWQPVVVFTFIEYTYDASHNLVERTSTDVIAEDEYITKPVLRFTMEPEEVLFDVPNVRTITESFGWQANFAPVDRRGHERFR